MITARQLLVLQLIADDLKHGRRWANRVLTSVSQRQPGQQIGITWEEMQWLQELERQAFTIRIEAIFIVEGVAHVK